MEYIPLPAFEMDNFSQDKSIINRLKNNKLKEHIKSFAITFVVSFALVLVSQIDSISLETIADGTILGVIFGATRAGVKAILELLIAKFS